MPGTTEAGCVALLQSDDLTRLEDLDTASLLADAETLLVSGVCTKDEFVLNETGIYSANSSENEQVDWGKNHRKKESTRRRWYRRLQKGEREELRRQEILLCDELSRVQQFKENEKAEFEASQTPAFWLWKATAT